MKQDLLMQFLQTSELLKYGINDNRKHHKNKESREVTKENINHRNSHKKMSFGARNTLLLLLNHERLNQRNIAKMLNISAQAVSEIIKKLLERELINKNNGELNNENIITLTAEGKVIAEKFNIKINLLADNIFKDFSEEEIKILENLITKIQQNKDEFICIEENKIY